MTPHFLKPTAKRNFEQKEAFDDNRVLVDIRKPQAKFSIITPSYNQGRFLEQTIHSVLSQTYGNLEHIIVDGGSTDDTVEILKKYETLYPMRWISEPDKGQAHAVNKGFKMAEGEIISWVNSDDVYFSSDVLSQAARAFEARRDIDVIYGNRVQIDEKSRLIKLQYSKPFDYNMLLKGYWQIYSETVFMRRKVIEEFQLDENLEITLDSEFWLRIGPHFKFKYLASFLGGFRVHRKNKTVKDSYLQQWNYEKSLIVREYGAVRHELGKKFPLARLFNQLKGLFSGAYNSYFNVPADIWLLSRFPAERLAFPFKMEKGKLLHYMQRSITPCLR